jgi:hypothetical protein
MARVRSPNYPALSLAETVERVGRVFQKEHRHPSPKDVVIKGMGYGSVNGASLSALSAALKYGLLDRQGDQYRVSDRALTILHPHTPEEKAEAIRAAAAAPPLFADMMKDFPGSIPSDENLRAYLIRRGFAAGALTSVIQAFRETLEVVTPETTGYDASRDKSSQTRPPMENAASSRRRESDTTVQLPVPEERAHKTNRIRAGLTDAGDYEVNALLIDTDGFDRLIKALQVNRMLFEVIDPGIFDPEIKTWSKAPKEEP